MKIQKPNLEIKITLKDNEMIRFNLKTRAYKFIGKNAQGTCRVEYAPGLWNEFDFDGLEDFKEKLSADTELPLINLISEWERR